MPDGVIRNGQVALLPQIERRRHIDMLAQSCINSSFIRLLTNCASWLPCLMFHVINALPQSILQRSSAPYGFANSQSTLYYHTLTDDGAFQTNKSTAMLLIPRSISDSDAAAPWPFA